MTKVPSFLLTVFVLVVFAGMLSSCRKSDRNSDTDLQNARDMSLAYACWNDLVRQLNVFASSQPDVNATPGPSVNVACGTIAVTPALPNPTFPKIGVIDYGSTNCEGTDGATRKGQLIASFTGNFRDSLTVITITTNNYYVNGNKVDGTFTITNKGRNAAGHPLYTDKTTDAVFTYSNGKKVDWKGTQTREMIQGDTTALIFDDVYQLSGTAVGTGSDGNLLNAYISQPLIFSMDCPWIKSGTLYLDPANLGNRFINFGTGDCDNKASVWIFGGNFPLYLY